MLPEWLWCREGGFFSASAAFVRFLRVGIATAIKEKGNVESYVAFTEVALFKRD